LWSRRQVLKALPAVAAGLGAPACGYALAGRGSFLPAYIQTIGIPMFGNTTPYQTVEQVFTQKVRLEFQSRNREKGNTERFVFVCGTEGPLAAVPVFIRYQPKWWFKVEGVLDEDETL